MWCKQFSWYEMQGPLLLEGESLEEALQRDKAYKPHATQQRSIGWISPLGPNESFLQETQGYLWLAVRIDSKLLPANVVNEELKEQLMDKEAQQGYPVSSKQRRVLKEEITLDLLPKAFVQSKRFNVVIDRDNQLLMIDTTSGQIRDIIVELLRKTVGSCPLTHYQESKAKIAETLKGWVMNAKAPDPVGLESNCLLVHANNINAKVRVAGHELDSPLIISHLEQGMNVTQLSINHEGRINCTLNDQLDITQIKYLDTMEDREKQEDPQEQMIADFTLWVPYYFELIQGLKTWFNLMPEEVSEPVDG